MTLAADPTAAAVARETTREWLTVDEVAARLSLSRSVVYRLMRQGQLAYIKLGRSRRIDVAELADFRARLRAEQGL